MPALKISAERNTGQQVLLVKSNGAFGELELEGILARFERSLILFCVILTR